MTFNDIISNFRDNPRDVHTIPTQPKRTPVWFYTHVENNKLYVEAARAHSPKSKINGRREILPAEFKEMLVLYHERRQGKSVSKEATKTTVNQVYWYGIFHEIDKSM